MVRENLKTLLAQGRESSEHGLPRFVEREFRRYLDCGILAHGFPTDPERSRLVQWIQAGLPQ